MSKHTLSVLVENKPGVLARIASLFSRRGFNIDSLAVGETEHPEISRMTVVVDVEDLPLEQVTKQLNKLVEVLKVVELESASAVQRQVMLIKVRADAATRSQVLEMVQMFRAKVVDVATESLVRWLPLGMPSWSASKSCSVASLSSRSHWGAVSFAI